LVLAGRTFLTGKGTSGVELVNQVIDRPKELVVFDDACAQWHIRSGCFIWATSALGLSGDVDDDLQGS
jgi:hypothetical protein